MRFQKYMRCVENHGIITLFKAGNGRMAIQTVIAEQSWYNKLKNPAAARLPRFALIDSFAAMSGEIKCSLRSHLISPICVFGIEADKIL